MTAKTVTLEAILEQHMLRDALPQIGQYIARQRWSGAQDITVTGTAITDAALLTRGEPTLLFATCLVSYSDGRGREYALPLGIRPAGDALAERAPGFMIIAGREHPGILYDALGDPAYIHWLWQAIRDRRITTTANGLLRCVCPDPSRLEQGATPTARVLTVEQTNTSVEVGAGTFLKHLRRIEPGQAQELEMTSTLTAQGFSHIAPMLAHVLYERAELEPAPLVLVQPFLRNSADGWALALTSLRDLYADAEEALARDEHDAAAVVAAQGGSFAGESARLGGVISEMHLRLAGAEQPGMRAEPLTAVTLDRWADSMHADLEAMLAQEVEALQPLRSAAAGIRASFDALRGLRPAGETIRIHGDLHLGQTLRTDSGWMILDFEGEPNRTPQERRTLSSPLRDVAGMLRSFDYAAAVALTERVLPESADWEGLMLFGDQWAAQNRRAFWAAYSDSVAGSALLPPAHEARILVRAFELQKAVYEVGYEANHRPTWVSIPLRFLGHAAHAGS